MGVTEMTANFINELQRKIDAFKETQLTQSLFMADDPSRWLYEVDFRASRAYLEVIDAVTGNKLNFTTSLAGSAIKTKMTQIG